MDLPRKLLSTTWCVLSLGTLAVPLRGADNDPPAPAPIEVAPAPAEAGAPMNSATINISEDGMVELDFQDMDFAAVLRLLAMQAHRNIVASKDVKGVISANVSKVTFTEALEALLVPNGMGYVEKGNFIYVYTAKELDEIRKASHVATTRVYRLKYVNATDAAALIKPVLSTTGSSAITPVSKANLEGAGTSEINGNAYSTDDALVVVDFPENHLEIARVIKELDVRPKQVLIESTILRAELKENNALGVDLVSLSGVNFGQMDTANSTGGTITPLPRTASNQFGNMQNGLVPNAQNAQSNLGTSFANDAVPTNSGVSFGFLSSNVSVFLKALEEITDTTIVANPKILALNKHRGEVFIGQHSGYLTTTVSATTSTQSVQFLDTGTKLMFRPFIGDDGYVRLEVHPEDSAGGVTNNLPNSQSTEVTSNLMVRDGRTVVIGGLFREENTASRGQVPILGNIPVLGLPFRRTNDSIKRTETIVLITPHIINDDTAMYVEAEKKQEDVARMLLGSRSGLQPWGRDRIAQAWYTKAQEAAQKGQQDKALMYTDWALNANPRFIEASRMRESLTRRKLQEVSNSTVQTFVRDILANEKAPASGTGGHYPPPEVEEAKRTPTTAPAAPKIVAPPAKALVVPVAPAAPAEPAAPAAPAAPAKAG